MRTILVTEPEYFDEDAMKAFRGVGKVVARRFKRSELEREIPDADALVVRIETRVDGELLSRARKLKVIGSATTGLNHIDVDFAKMHNIQIVSLSGTHTTSTAEHTFAVILALSRRIPWAFEGMKAGRWERHRFIGMQLEGKILGIIGLGRIGSRVAEYAKGFGMKTIYFDPYVPVSKLAKKVSLNTLVKSADIITLHATLTKDTRNLIDAEQFRKMKRGALIINMAREGLVNTGALLKALKSGTVGGAAIDVFENEPLEDKEHRLVAYARQHDNLVLTPHIGASTKEAAHEAGVEIAIKVAETLSQDAHY